VTLFPSEGSSSSTLLDIASRLRCKIISNFKAADGNVPAQSTNDLHLFYEYFDGETGRGCGASHQTGWTALLANLIIREMRSSTSQSQQGKS
jgi:hypothetical protein